MGTIQGLSIGVLFGVLLSSCQASLPKDPVVSALYRDLRRIVLLEEAKGWTIDKYEVDEIVPTALQSICGTELGTSKTLSTWLSDEKLRLGGDPAEFYQKNGQSLEGMGALLSLHRIQLLLDTAAEKRTENCPFWQRPSSDFRGRQLISDRWALSFGGGGKLIGVKQGDRYDVNFGGAGRLLIGRGLNEHWAAFAGFELGGGAGFPRDQNGQRGQITVLVDVVAQASLRYQIVNSYFELESGYLVQTRENALSEFSHGFRVGIAYGLQYSRQLLFLPGASFGVSYDHLYGREGSLYDTSYLKFGFRGAFDMPL
ncbi:MAG: hypothetical protein VYC39_12610 [Myxococcota bacterium]|nr:hypothetical protein [Myxococcota bacterium]